MGLALFEFMQMADRIKIFPLIALAVVVVMGLVLYWVATRPRETITDPVPEAPRPPAAPPKRTVEAPPPTTDPGQKILDGAEGAFTKKMFPTALMFYKDFELRYAGSEVYDRNITLVWERIHTSNAQCPPQQQEADLPAYLDKRRKLADEWKRLKPLMTVPPPAEAKAELEKFMEPLPPMDGRRRIIDAWRESK
ncbi:MAG TPA: hypothetical protein VFD06_14395 [Candidatus Polarisedimenticolia bacterium]|nr:hypothetical protein [Candidatus Polarisedimenticolia bacterium]